MKWPNELLLMRHCVSDFNHGKNVRAADPLYQAFLAEWKRGATSPATQSLARQVQEKFPVIKADHETDLAPGAGDKATQVGIALRKRNEPLPNIIFVSPYRRTLETLRYLTMGWPELVGVKTVHEERIIEQDHGLACLYNDWRIFFSLHPDQYHLNKLQGSYRYCYPQGENIPNVRLRNLSWFNTLTRDFASKNVLAIAHHLTILSIRANLERLSPKQFRQLDHQDKPINCGVTTYIGLPNEGSNGRLALQKYNEKLFED